MNIEKRINPKNITVIDSIMGSGKTTWAINYINSTDDNILYITPFKDEIKRILSSVERPMCQPVNHGKGKMINLSGLLKRDDDIAATHELFKHLNDECQELLSQKHYTLILDEVLNVLEPIEMKKSDLPILLDSKCITISEDGFVSWNPEKTNYESRYDEIKTLAENHTLMVVNNCMFMWRYPPEIFELFDNIIIMTYLFDASIMSAYFKMFNITYEVKSIKRKLLTNDKIEYYLTDYYEPDTTIYQKLIKIYNGVLNKNFNPKNKETSLSKNWFSSTESKNDITTLRKNMVNFRRNIFKAKSDTILWTTFIKFNPKLAGEGYSKSFLSCNARSTNEYADRYNLMYAVNIYMHPMIVSFLKDNGVEIDDETMDKYALSEMLQWIWRSRIRNHQSINIYIPSMRMRLLLEQWLKMDHDTQKAA